MDGRGGIQTHCFWLSRALLESGYEVVFFSLAESVSNSEVERIGKLRYFGNIHYEHSSKPAGLTRPSAVTSAMRICRSLRRHQPEVYLACGTGWNLFLPVIASLRCPRRVFHEVMSGEASSYRDSRWAVRYGFHKVIAQASQVACNFKRSFSWPGDVPVLPAFPEPLELTSSLSIQPRNTVPLGHARAALFSRLVPHKQALWLVRQWPLLANHLAELHIFGTGPEEQLIKALISEQGWQGRVFCHGPYPDGQEYVDLLSTFDLTLLPTVGAEGAPLVLLESMACGVPFVAFGAGGIPDYANSDCNIVPVTGLNAFVPSVKELLVRIALGNVDRDRLRKFYLNNFSYARLKSRWLEYLSGLARE